MNIIAHFCFISNDIPLNSESTRFALNALHLLETDMHLHVEWTTILVRNSPKNVIRLNVKKCCVCSCLSNAVKIVLNVKVIPIQCRLWTLNNGLFLYLFICYLLCPWNRMEKSIYAILCDTLIASYSSIPLNNIAFMATHFCANNMSTSPISQNITYRV